MSEDQLTALLEMLKQDEGLREKLKGAADIESAQAIAKDAGFEISKAAWMAYQAKLALQLTDEELEGLTGGQGVALGACGTCSTTPRAW